jgi:hypothetical protein
MNPPDENPQLQPSDAASGALPPETGGSSDAVRGRMGYLYKQYAFLETLVALTISALILSSLGLNLFLFKQMRLVRGQLNNQKQISTSILEEFHSKREPSIHNFVNKLQAYADTKPEFRVILDKYRTPLAKYFATPPETPAPSAAPAPAPVKASE